MPIFVAVLLVGGFLLVGMVGYRLVGMYLMKEIDGLELTVFLLVLIGLMIGAVVGGGGLAAAALVLLWLVGMSYPVLNHLHWRARMNALIQADIRSYEEALRRQPDVPYPHRRLGDIYFERRQWARAAEHYQQYLEKHNLDAYCANRLERALLYRRREEMGLRTCPVCGAENARAAARCGVCGFYLKGWREILDALSTPGMMRVWRWLILAFLLPALVLAMVPHGPMWLRALILTVSVAATVLYLYARLSGRERSQQA